MLCSKCSGCVLWNHFEHYCVNCGNRPLQPSVTASGETMTAKRDAQLCACGAPVAPGLTVECRPCRNRRQDRQRYLRQIRKRGAAA